MLNVYLISDVFMENIWLIFRFHKICKLKVESVDVLIQGAPNILKGFSIAELNTTFKI